MSDFLPTLETTALTAPARGFDIHEFEQRTLRAQSLMRDQQIDLLFLMAEHDVRYFSGFDTQFWQSPTRPWFLLLPQTGKPTAVIPSIGLACMQRTWIEEILTWSSPHPEDDGIGLLADTIISLTGHSAVIGVPMGRETALRMPLLDFQRLQKNLKNTRWRDATSITQSLRQVKSEAEIDKIRYAARVVSEAFTALPQLLKPGMTEIDAFKRFKHACLQLGADDTPYVVGASGPGGYLDIISPPSDRRLQSGDILIIDTGCIWDGYFCDFDRNFAIGEPVPAAENAYRIIRDATDAGLEAAKPGASCRDVFSAMHSVMQPHAVKTPGDVGRLGHGLGMQLTETPSLTAFDDTILQSGMVLTLEPGYSYDNDKTMVHEENIVVRDNGPELLSTRAATTLPVIN